MLLASLCILNFTSNEAPTSRLSLTAEPKSGVAAGHQVSPTAQGAVVNSAQVKIPQAISITSDMDVVDVLLVTGKHRTFVKLCNKAGLLEMMKQAKQLTVMAPTDAALNTWLNAIGSRGPEIIKSDPKRLSSLLKYHLVTTAVRIGGLAEGALTPIYSEPLFVKIKPTLLIGNARPSGEDLGCANGNVIVLNDVLIPPSFRQLVSPVLAPKPGRF